MRNHLLSYVVLILEASFHDVWVECNVTFYWAPIDYLWIVMLSFGKVGGSRNSHEMWLSGIPGMGLLISSSLLTYTANIGIWRGSIPMYASMFWVTLAVDSTSFGVGFHDNGIHDAHWSMSVKDKVPNEWMRSASNDALNKMNDTKGVRIG